MEKKIAKGKIKNAQALEINGIKFKSKLEYFTYKKLLEFGIHDFKYEEYKFNLLNPFEFNNECYEVNKKTKNFEVVKNDIRAITYLPDFGKIHEDKTGWIMECKGFPNDAFPLKWKWFKQHLMENGYNLTIYKPNNQQNVLKAIELIKNKYYG